MAKPRYSAEEIKIAWHEWSNGRYDAKSLRILRESIGDAIATLNAVCSVDGGAPKELLRIKSDVDDKIADFWCEEQDRLAGLIAEGFARP
jgi:hypothetical protein